MASVKPFKKYAAEVERFGFLWTARLNGETISSHSMVVPSPLTTSSPDNTASVTSALFSGGVKDVTYDCVCQVITSGGRTLREAFQLQVM